MSTDKTIQDKPDKTNKGSKKDTHKVNSRHFKQERLYRTREEKARQCMTGHTEIRQTKKAG